MGKLVETEWQEEMEYQEETELQRQKDEEVKKVRRWTGFLFNLFPGS